MISVSRVKAHRKVAIIRAIPQIHIGRMSFWDYGKNLKDPIEVIEKEGNGKSPGEEKTLTIHNSAPKLTNIIGLPIARRPVFPGLLQAAIVKDEKTANAILKSGETGMSYLGVFLRTDTKKGGNTIEVPELITSIDQVHKVGTFVQVQSMIRVENGLQLLLMGHRRINLEDILNYGPPVNMKVNHWKKISVVENNAIKAYRNELLMGVRELFKLNPLAQEYSAQWLSRIELSDAMKLADFAAAITTAEAEDLQKVLDASDPEERLSLALDLVMKEKELAKLQRDISKQVSCSVIWWRR
jgi:ATP-dependent Lon protease